MGLDLALRLWRQGYDAIPADRGWPVGRDAFVSRMLGRCALGLDRATGAWRQRGEVVVSDELVRAYGAAVTYAGHRRVRFRSRAQPTAVRTDPRRPSVPASRDRIRKVSTGSARMAA